MIQIIISMLVFIIIVIPMGRYLYKVSDNKKTMLDCFFDPTDNFIYRICGIDCQNMKWEKYLKMLLAINITMILIGYFILRAQGVLCLNPNDISSMESSLAFNTIVSFMTNTNLQHYSGESSLSYFSQMTVITMLMFTSAATGYAACIAMVRGICGKKMGNCFVDIVRIVTRVLLPISIIACLLLVSQGVPQTMEANKTVFTIEGKYQDIALGPIASLEAIKHLGTNGGGFLGANSSTPFENPNIITNMLEMFLMMLLPGACVITFGLMAYYKKMENQNNLVNSNMEKPLFGGEGKSIFLAMSILFIIGLVSCYFAESSGNPLLNSIGLNRDMGSYEGKETRFGIAQSAMFSAVTTSFTTGTVNNMHDTLTPLGGLVALLNMMLNTVFGGVGVGLMNMLLYVIITVFVCGLMIGRTPEYLGKKIESREVKLAVLSIIVHPLLILGFTALAVSTKAGLEGITNPGYHGLTQILYEFSSAAANNGSGFEGLADNSFFWNISTGITMFFGRYLSIVLQLAIAGSLLEKIYLKETIGTLRTASIFFSVVTAGTVLILAGLTFLPVISLGPIAEHLTLWR